MTKEAIRAEMAGRVKNLSPVYCREADAAICRWVEQSEFYREARTVFCYVGAKWEIDTTALLRSALASLGKAPACALTLPSTAEAGLALLQSEGFAQTGVESSWFEVV